jgi:SAM-dependent methyltransferase
VSSPTIWSSGHYEAVAERIARIAADVIDAVEGRLPLREAMLVDDLACGTGSAALAAASRGARVTTVDFTPNLIAIGAHRAEVAGRSLTWVTADASDTGLPDRSFDAVVSNMGTIFVEPTRQVAELGRLLKAGGVLAFSSWVHDTANPFFSPILNVLGAPRRRATRPINGVTRARSRHDCRPTSTTSRSNPPFTLGNSRRWTRQCASSRMSHQCTYRCSATSTKRSTTGW